LKQGGGAFRANEREGESELKEKDPKKGRRSRLIRRRTENIFATCKKRKVV